MRMPPRYSYRGEGARIMSKMTENDLLAVEQVFDMVLQISPEQRERFFDLLRQGYPRRFAPKSK
jgi:hypothetical protein